MTISDDLARDAFVYGFSMDEAYKFLYRTAIAPGVRLNEFEKIRQLADDTYTDHPTINNDTLHLQGWLDVGAEPVVITVPDVDEGRYWILHTMDLGHYTNAMFGSRTRGATGGRFLFAATRWAGAVPDGIDEVVRSDSDLVKVMGRIMAVDDPADLAKAQALMDRWELETLSHHLGEPGPEQVHRDYPDPEHATWLERVNFVLGAGSLAEADQRWLDQYGGVGLAPDKRDFTDEQLAAAATGERLGMAHIKELAPKMTSSVGLLGTREQLGDGPRDLFAEGTYIGQWGLPPEESGYQKVEVGSDGLQINGSGGKRYRMLFRAPDVSEFWSFTVYGNDDRLMAHNDLNRHSRGDRTLTPDADGRYSIELGADTTGRAHDANFLPIPEKDSYIILRLYGPSKDVQAGAYATPIPEVI